MQEPQGMSSSPQRTGILFTGMFQTRLCQRCLGPSYSARETLNLGTAGQSAAKRSEVCEERLQVREQCHRDADRPAVGAPGGEEEASNKAAYAGQDNWWKGGN